MAKQPDGGESLRTVLIALAANALIAVAKSVAAAITGSASLVAEAAHSWADTGNEVFLLAAERRGDKPADERHPLGYGRAAYVWAFVAAFGLFAVGSALSISTGISALTSHEPASDYGVGYAVLGIALVLEGTSFLQAHRQARAAASEFGVSAGRYIARTSETTVRSVFLEDFSAIIGIAIAAGGLFLHQVTGNAGYDAIGSILVGILLGVIALFLMIRNGQFLIGEPASSTVLDRFRQRLLDHPDIDRLTFLHLEFVGPSKFLVVAAVDLTEDDVESRLALRLQAIEDEISALDSVQRCLLSLSAPSDPGV
ncbi:MAG: cation diffusion facilitator family transporter [Nostocoides sp.]